MTLIAKLAILNLQSELDNEEVNWVKTKIPQLRKERKLSQTELADAVGVSRQPITSIEVGKYTDSLVLAWRIAQYFEMAIEEVFDFSEEEVL